MIHALFDIFTIAVFDNIAKLSNLGNRTITRFLAGEDVKISTMESSKLSK
jgi:hypothetical protein